MRRERLLRQSAVENLNIADRDLFTQWYADAANALHAGGFTDVLRNDSRSR